MPLARSWFSEVLEFTVAPKCATAPLLESIQLSAMHSVLRRRAFWQAMEKTMGLMELLNCGRCGALAEVRAAARCSARAVPSVDPRISAAVAAIKHLAASGIDGVTTSWFTARVTATEAAPAWSFWKVGGMV
jgi:hypothetical protein